MAVSALTTYNPDILAVTCRRCRQAYPDRCKAGYSMNLTAAHGVRIRDAGYTYDRKTGVLSRIDDLKQEMDSSAPDVTTT